MSNETKVMIISYKAKLESVEKNSLLVKKVMNKLNELKPEGLQYASILSEDGQTFTHIVHISNPESQNIIPGLEEFKEFQKDIEARCEVPPNLVSGSIVGNYALF